MLSIVFFFVFFFFFSSRRRHTRYWRDWSSDVCSSDLSPFTGKRVPTAKIRSSGTRTISARLAVLFRESRSWACTSKVASRSEERRVGKECRSRWSRYDEKKKEEERRE